VRSRWLEWHLDVLFPVPPPQATRTVGFVLRTLSLPPPKDQVQLEEMRNLVAFGRAQGCRLRVSARSVASDYGDAGALFKPSAKSFHASVCQQINHSVLVGSTKIVP
jgi:hypothetical protein